MKTLATHQNMPGRGPTAAAATLTAEEFAARYQAATRVLWTVAAGVLGGPSEADDVLQEACVIALDKLDHFDKTTNFTAWMGRFVRNVALNQVRKSGRRRTTPTDPETLGGLPANAREPRALPVNGNGKLASDQEAFDDQVLGGLRELSPDQRACVLLRTVLDLSYREIAATLEMPEGTAMSHVHRARQALRISLIPEERASQGDPS